jgi:hypothetical protein
MNNRQRERERVALLIGGVVLAALLKPPTKGPVMTTEPENETTTWDDAKLLARSLWGIGKQFLRISALVFEDAERELRAWIDKGERPPMLIPDPPPKPRCDECGSEFTTDIRDTKRCYRPDDNGYMRDSAGYPRKDPP